MRSASNPKILNNEKGITTVLMAGMIFFLVFCVGIAVDLGYMYVVKGQLQNAADAGSLAGAAIINPYDSTTFTPAKQLAKDFAEKNKAAGTLLTEAVALNLLKNYLDTDNDVTYGNWNPSLDPKYDTNRTPYNAVQVRVRRTSDNPNPAMGQINLFFSKVFGWNKMSAAAEAIADAEPAPFLPIAVNEYWWAVPSGGVDDRPYGALHNYPHSFVRQTNVDGSTNTGASGTYGKTFAILGSDANDNIPTSEVKGARNMNGYVQLDARSSRHDGTNYPDGTPSWWLVTGPSLNGCIGGFNGPTAINSGFINAGKFDASLEYLFNGYTANYPIPTAVKEQPITPVSNYPTYSADWYPIPTSSEPYATIAYFSSSGNQPLSTKFEGKYFKDVYPIGKKIITMVYDGTFKPYPDQSMPNAVTNVGFVLIQIDGYANQNPKFLLNENFLKNDGGTAYGHVLYPIVEPSPSESGLCDPGSSFRNSLNWLFYAGATVRLVK